MEQIIFSVKEVNGLKKNNPFKKNFQLDIIDFELPAGYIMGIVGKNGAGKTTFFNYIMSEKKKYSGEMFLDGINIHSDHIWALDNIGFISEVNSFLPQRTTLENAKMLGSFYSTFDLDLFEKTLEYVTLSKNKIVGTLSRGEFMKFQLAFAIAHHPKLFLIDEATAGMDPVFRIDFFKLLHNIIETENCSVIMSTHLEDEIEKQMDYLGFFENGHFVTFKENELV